MLENSGPTSPARATDTKYTQVQKQLSITIHTYVWIHTHTYILMHNSHTYKNICTHTYKQTHIQILHSYIHAHTYIHTYFVVQASYLRNTYILTLTCVRAYNFLGDHIESASPADPSFWVIHPTLGQFKFIVCVCDAYWDFKVCAYRTILI